MRFDIRIRVEGAWTNAGFYRAEGVAAQIELLPRAMRVTGPMMRATIGGIFLPKLLAVAGSAFVEFAACDAEISDRRYQIHILDGGFAILTFAKTPIQKGCEC